MPRLDSYTKNCLTGFRLVGMTLKVMFDTILIFKSEREHILNLEKCVLLLLKNSFRS